MAICIKYRFRRPTTVSGLLDTSRTTLQPPIQEATVMTLAHLPLRVKLGLAFGVLLALVLAVSSLSLVSLGTADDNFEGFVEGITARTATANSLRNAVDARAIAARNLVLVIKSNDIQLETEQVKRSHADVQSSLAKLKELAKAPDVPEKARDLIAKIDAVEQSYGPVALKIVDFAFKGEKDAAVADMNEKCRPLLAQLVKASDEYAAFSASVAARLATASNVQYAHQRNILVGAAVLSVLIAVVAAYLVTRSITVPVGEALKLAEAVARGDLTQDVKTDGKDEVSRLLTALSKMNASLASIVSQVRGSSESIATGSAQIATGNLDLSQRTEEQASALQQTAATMEELTATIKNNSDNAQQANQLALSATAIASRGGDVVNEAVGTMRTINDSSKKISEIISVIDGIAFQTNILALNAAVEAARAGEQGRGFAVVASEVRSLAKRSADAAKEIKTLIEASVRQVDRGTKQVDAAGATMAEIVGAFKRVGDIVAEISSASIEQSSGASQVGEAVSQMDQVTQQNAALVEESAAAAESLKLQSENLVKAVATFSLAPCA
jgi:methyl-accepting chemotaxis protein-1 (serine sensor receptor)